MNKLSYFSSSTYFSPSWQKALFASLCLTVACAPNPTGQQSLPQSNKSNHSLLKQAQTKPPLATATTEVTPQPGKPGYAQIKVQLKLARPVSGFKTQHIDGSVFTSMIGQVRGIQMDDIYADGSTGGPPPFVTFAAGNPVVTFSNIPYGKARVMSFELSGVEADGTTPVSTLLMAGFDLDSTTKTIDINYSTYPVGVVAAMAVDDTFENQEKISRFSMADIQSLVEQSINKSPLPAPQEGFYYSPAGHHPYLINAEALYNSLLAHNMQWTGVPGDLSGSSIGAEFLPPIELTGNISGLVSSDKVDIRINDESSHISTEQGNGVYFISEIRPTHLSLGHPRYGISNNTQIVITPAGLGEPWGAGTTYYPVFDFNPTHQELLPGVQITKNIVLHPASPRVTSISTTTGNPGDTITLYGSYFHANADGNTVRFGTTAVPTANITVVNANEMQVKVPLGLSPGTVPITVNVGTSSSTVMGPDMVPPPAPPEFTIAGETPIDIVVFASDRDGGGTEIYRMDLDGSNPVRLTHDNAGSQHPDVAWSESENKLKVVFVKNDGLYTMDIDGSNEQQIETFPQDRFYTYPKWSPDGSDIIFTENNLNNSDTSIWKRNGYGTLIELIDDNQASYPVWFPGYPYAFFSIWRPSIWDPQIKELTQSNFVYVFSQSGSPEIYAIPHSSPYDPIALTQGLNFDNIEDLRTSPDGRTFLFKGTISGNSLLYTLKIDGTQLTPITTVSNQDFNADWSDDGSKIYFTSTRDGNPEIYRMNPNGSLPERVTNQAGVDGQASVYKRVQTPVLSSLSTTQGGSGDTTAINGLNFNPISEHNVVTFTENGYGGIEIPAEDVVYLNSNQLQVKVPNASALSNIQIQVRINNKLSNTLPFNYYAYHATASAPSYMIGPEAPLAIAFSAPMERSSVENNFIIRSFEQNTFSVDNTVTLADGSNALDLSNPTVGTAVWDKNAFNITWNATNTVALFAFKDERVLPADKAFTQAYYVSFTKDDGILSNAQGIKRHANYFMLPSPWNKESGASSFIAEMDIMYPNLTNLTAHTNENNHPEGDGLTLAFSERMIHYTLDKTIAGGMNGNPSQAPAAIGSIISAEAAAANYTVTINRGGNIIASDTWANMGGKVVFDTTDVTHKTIHLLAFNQEILQPGDLITVEVAESVMDPAGNTMEYSYTRTLSTTAS